MTIRAGGLAQCQPSLLCDCQQLYHFLRIVKTPTPTIPNAINKSMYSHDPHCSIFDTR